jgi:hypothetical protein
MIRLGMSGEAVITPQAPSGPGRAGDPPETTFTIPATALFHRGDSPAVWVVDVHSHLVLRPVKVREHGARDSVVTSGLKNGDVIVVAGVHAVYAGEVVKAVRPLFDEQGEVSGPAALAQEGADSSAAQLASTGRGASK